MSVNLHTRCHVFVALSYGVGRVWSRVIGRLCAAENEQVGGEFASQLYDTRNDAVSLFSQQDDSFRVERYTTTLMSLRVFLFSSYPVGTEVDHALVEVDT